MANLRSAPENTSSADASRILESSGRPTLSSLDAADASERLCLRQASLRLPAEEAAASSVQRALVALYRQGMPMG